MKKRVLGMAFVLALTAIGCVGTSGDGVENTERTIATEVEDMSESTGNLLEGAEIIGGDSTPTTDGYGLGVEIVITPIP